MANCTPLQTELEVCEQKIATLGGRAVITVRANLRARDAQKRKTRREAGQMKQCFSGAHAYASVRVL